MAVGGVTKKEFPKKVGVFEGKVIAINPDREQYQDLTGFEVAEDSKQFDYLGEDKDGVTTSRINVLLEEAGTKQIMPVNFFLKDKVKTNKDGTKTQYINSVGLTTWAASESDIKPWFTKFDRTFREAKEGEEELYKFLRAWLSNINFFDKSADLSLDTKKLLNGNMRELTEQISGTNSTSVLSLATIRTVVKEGEEDKEFQNIYNRDFLPGNRIKNFRLVKYDEAKIKSLKEKKAEYDEHNKEVKSNPDSKAKQKYMKDYEDFVLNISDSEHGVKDFYTFEPLREYDPTENPVHSDAALQDKDENDGGPVY